MKKLMIAFAGVALALGAQAARITYEMTTAFEGSLSDVQYYSLYARAAEDTSFGKDRKTIEDYFANAVKGGTWETAKAAWLAQTEPIKTAAGHEFKTKNFTTDNTLTFDRKDSEEQYNYWAVVFYKNGDKEGFRVIQAVDPKSTSSLGTTLTEGKSGTWGDWKAVPEPTSGMLMLLGLAGLALKRKRA